MMNENYLKVEELKDGYLYEMDARNASFGIWNAKKGYFHIARMKFNVFLCVETHWDLDDVYGTAKPLREIEKFDGNYMLEYLNEYEGR